MNKKTKIIHKEIFFYNGKDFSNLHRPPLFLINREINCRWCGRDVPFYNNFLIVFNKLIKILKNKTTL